VNNNPPVDRSAHPTRPTHQHQQDEIDFDSLRLSLINGIGPRQRAKLVAHFGSPREVFDAGRNALQQLPGIGVKLANAIVTAESEIDIEHVLNHCRSNGISIADETSPGYPHWLSSIEDAPAIIYYQGEFLSPDAVAVGIVGTRHGTPYGIQQAESLAANLARAGVTVVSGLARGIDAAAHRGALEAGGRTIAVLGSGLLKMYPPEHQDLAEQIAQQGVVVSELQPESPPRSGSFPQRNRIISGLSLGVVVVEASMRSGALITARLAMEQNREVFAVPGRVDNRCSKGCHQLLRDGAKLVESVDDVLEELGPLAQPSQDAQGSMIDNARQLTLNPQEKIVLEAIERTATSIDSIVQSTELPVHRVLSTISVLEMRHFVHRISGNTVAKS